MSFNILLSDQSVEKLDPTTLRQGEENVLYCSIKINASKPVLQEKVITSLQNIFNMIEKAIVIS